MTRKTSQLQIRVTMAEKQTLKRLASEAGKSLSAYVLSRALPAVSRDLDDAVAKLAEAGGHPTASGELAALIRDLPADELTSGAARPSLDGLAPRAQNVVAALVEEAAYLKGVDPPGWTVDVAPLPGPHFRWALPSLKPHQLRVTPAPFKRRNLFFDPASRDHGAAPEEPPTRTPEAAQALERLSVLGRELALLELDVEFYIVHGAFMYQAFQAHPRTAHISMMFRPSREIQATAGSVATREGWPYDWLSSTVKAYLMGRPARFLELPGIRAFAPPLEYALGVKVAALRLGRDPRGLDDVRYLLRAADLSTAHAAYDIVTRYFGERQLPTDTLAVLEELLS